MNRPTHLALVLFTATTACGYSAPVFAGTTTDEWDAPPREWVLRGREVAVYNPVGEIRVEPTRGRDVRVDVETLGTHGEEIRVETGRIGSAETLRVLLPDDRILYPRLSRGSRSQIRVRDDGTFGRGGRQITVTGSGRGTEAFADLVVRVPEGQRIAVHQGIGRVWVTNVDGEIRVETQSARVDAEGTRGPLNVDVGSGSVRVRDARGDLDVDTGSGSVEVGGVRGSRVRIDTGSGSVSGLELETNELNVDVGSGSVRLAELRARDARVDTGSGSVEIELVAPVRSLLVDTGSGGVKLSVPRDLGAELEIDTGSGGIDVDVPVRVRKSSRSHLLGQIGDGEGRIRIDTGSGGVSVRER